MVVQSHEAIQLGIFAEATQALADQGFPQPKIAISLRRAGLSVGEAASMFGLNKVRELGNKRLSTKDEVGLMFDLAKKKYWRLRADNDSDRLASLEGAAINRILEHKTHFTPSGELIAEGEHTPLQLAMAQFLLSDVVQSYKN